MDIQVVSIFSFNSKVNIAFLSDYFKILRHIPQCGNAEAVWKPTSGALVYIFTPLLPHKPCRNRVGTLLWCNLGFGNLPLGSLPTPLPHSGGRQCVAPWTTCLQR